MRKLLRKAFRKYGYELVPFTSETPTEFDSLRDFSEEDRRIVVTARPFTMTSVERMAALVNAVTYITEHKLPGDIAECGVWRGGSMMTMAMKLLAVGDRSRSLYLYDTYEGMSEPSEHDIKDNGTPAADLHQGYMDRNKRWCYASLEDVHDNILSTGYPEDKVHLIKGKVEDTIPKSLPGRLAILRLDTDWYESTRHELVHLYPLLHAGGVMVIDDYGHWQGARKAVDEFFAAHREPVYLHRIDYTGRMMIKGGA
jgi:hypothetical protein